jgi:hypothetical protein
MIILIRIGKVVIHLKIDSVNFLILLSTWVPPVEHLVKSALSMNPSTPALAAESSSMVSLLSPYGGPNSYYFQIVARYHASNSTKVCDTAPSYLMNSKLRLRLAESSCDVRPAHSNSEEFNMVTDQNIGGGMQVLSLDL